MRRTLFLTASAVFAVLPFAGEPISAFGAESNIRQTRASVYEDKSGTEYYATDSGAEADIGPTDMGVDYGQPAVVSGYGDCGCGGDSCGGACGDSCGADACCGCGEYENYCTCDKLFGMFVQSDPCFHDFISPMTNPVFFEDPRTLTEARVIYLRHEVPQEALGGEINLLACQLRAALTDRLSIIASKDGYATSTNPLIDDGWADISAGLKYNLYRDCARQQILSAGLTYEMPVGSPRTQQGNGDGLFHPFLSSGVGFGDGWHWLSGSGFWLPADTRAESSAWYWSNHLDRRLANGPLYVFVESNWYHYMGAGEAFNLAPIEGGDLFNLGSVGVAGNDIVTGAFGLKVKPSAHFEAGIAWENPLTQRRDVLHDRLTVDLIFRY